MVEKIHTINIFCYAKRRTVLITTIILQLDRMSGTIDRIIRDSNQLSV
jgi:hypothetical protein